MLRNNGYKSLNYVQFFITLQNKEDYFRNGGAYMATTQKTEQQKVKTSSANVSFPSELSQKFEQINNKYQSELSTWRNKQQELTLTDQEAKNQATENLSEYYNTQTNKINDNYQTKQEKLDTNRISNQNKYYDQLGKATDDYNQDVEDLRFDSIDKGWRVSSIYDNQLDLISNEYSQQKEALDNENKAYLDNLAFKQAILEQERESALEEFNLTYADKLTTEIEKIQQEFEKANASERENVDEQIEDILLDIGREKTAETLRYLQGKSKDEQIAFINDNPGLKDELGRWYDVFVAWVNR